MNKKTLIGLFILTILSCMIGLILNQKSLNQGGLHWQTLSQRFDLPPGTTTHSSSFAFRNNSSRPITLLSVKPDCNCLLPAFAQATIAPGGTGKIEVNFNPGDRAGTLQRTLVVRTKEFPNQIVRLGLTYHIPELVQISHRLLLWSAKDKPIPQEIELKMPDQKIKVTGVRSSSQDFACEILPIADGRDYKVRITPLQLTRAKQSILLIDTDFPSAPWNRIVAQARVQ